MNGAPEMNARKNSWMSLKKTTYPRRMAGVVVATCASLVSASLFAQDAPMSMGPMSGGRAPADARDPNAYADGYDYGAVPGMEKVDQLPIGKVFAEQVEGLSRSGRGGAAWDIQGWYGPDTSKLWVRTEGSVVGGKTGATTGAEGLWWRAFSPFWATQLGVRQDIGAGAHTYAAFGVQGLAPYWFEFEATVYVGEEGRAGARLKSSYDLLLTNRLILTPKIEANLGSRAEPRRNLGTGLTDLGIGLRLRYEFTRKFAPYIGYVWDRAVGSSADLLRAAGEPALDSQFVAGLRLWW